MTKNERRKFYDGLRKAKDKFQWKLTREGKVRGLLNGSYYCPLTAIAKAETGKRVASINFDQAESPTLDRLSDYLKNDVVGAADCPDLEHLDNEEKNLRKTMLRIVGLTS